jgi:hypothetical protein
MDELKAMRAGEVAFKSYDSADGVAQRLIKTNPRLSADKAAWLAQRWRDPIFPINFPWFGSRDYWQGQLDILIEQTEAMQAAPLVAEAPSEDSPRLRGQDGAVSELPAFLGRPTAAEPREEAPAAEAKKPRRRRAPRSFEGGEGAPAETEDA